MPRQPRPLLPILTLAAALAALAAAPARAGALVEIPGSAGSVGLWSLAGYRSDTGDFDHCAATLAYTGGEKLVLQALTDDRLAVVLSMPGVSHAPGQQFQARLMTEVGLPADGLAEALDSQHVSMTFRGIEDTVAFLSAGQTLRMLGVGMDAALATPDLGAAAALRDCARSQTAAP
ncbi:MAG: hypothetical protein R3D63_05085 [Paracoccaceae bacterium]